MKVFTFYTQDYHDELLTAFHNKEQFFLEIGKIEDLHYFKIDYERIDFDKITILLEKIVMYKNKAIISLKPFHSIRVAVFKKNEHKITEALKAFCSDNAELNLEGYVDFKLNVYTNAVNQALYDIVKTYMH